MSNKPLVGNKVELFLESSDENLQTEADYTAKAKEDNYGISKEFKRCIEKSIKHIVSLVIFLIVCMCIALLFLLIRYIYMVSDNENAIGEVINKILAYFGGVVSAVAINLAKKKPKND